MGAKNIVLYVADDLGWADVGYHGSNFPTPFIDDLARTGVEFDRFYTNELCSPSRSAIMTGRFSFRMGLQHISTIIAGGTAGLLPMNETTTIAESLKAAGYETHGVGKWHLGTASFSQLPLQRGFDTWVGYYGAQVDYYNWTFAANQAYPVDAGCAGYAGLNAQAFDSWVGNDVNNAAFGEYSVDAYDAEFKRIVGSAVSPFFVYFAQQLVHYPMDEPPSISTAASKICERIGGPDGRKTLCRMASRLDDSVRAAVEALDLVWNETVFWFFADNGGWTDDGFFATYSSNFPLRGGKFTQYEGGCRVPAFVTGGGLRFGRKLSALVHVVDVAATIRALARAPALNDTISTDGLDLWPLVTGVVEDSPTAVRDEIPLNVDVNPLQIWGVGPLTRVTRELNYSAIIVWPWKLVVGWGCNPNNAETTNPKAEGYWTIHDYVYLPPPVNDTDADVALRLYDINADPTESRNLATAFPTIANRLTRRLAYWSTSAGGFQPEQWNLPIPLGNPIRANWTWYPFLGTDQHPINPLNCDPVY
ncbi:hypothetical protein CTAYLR_003749 [Chrysophaeum taylorii]|uniref:Sulfatase N-terminal domain-containing protein n=1 Tax=Chrysophaeum taylorii TaxID=2483200 RepID=A0AAD7XIF1_9STRA|nr:hypothetical protein CTAYLR_003749 [Chrysophaeum taylorii]